MRETERAGIASQVKSMVSEADRKCAREKSEGFEKDERHLQ
jgi:hypothetical protein